MQFPEAESVRPADGARAITVAAAALIVAIVLSSLLTGLNRSGAMPNRYVVESLSYLVFWAPLVIAIAATARTGWTIPLRFRWIDLLWGLAVGLFARAISTVLDFWVYGSAGSTSIGAPLDESAGAMIFFVVSAFIAPLILGPMIEELFFRGTVLGALRGATTASRVIAVVVSSVVFALMHVLGASTPASALAIGLSTFFFALGAGSLAVSTNRLGGAITAHVVFNGSVIALAVAS